MCARTSRLGDRGDGDVVVEVAYSSVNYKDGLATIAKGQVARISPLVPGIDLAGTDEDSARRCSRTATTSASPITAATPSTRACRRTWLVPLPDGLSAKQAMAIGTAGYTAARCVMALEAAGLSCRLRAGAGDGRQRRRRIDGGRHPRGAGLRGRASSSGKDPEWLKALGASEVISREDASGDAGRPLEKPRWAGAVDCVGGEVLAGVLRSTRYGGAVAACGNTGGVKLAATVLPFILRGVSLLGVDSVQTPIDARKKTWQRLANDLRPPHLDETIAHETDLDGLDDALTAILRGRAVRAGRS